MLLNATTLCLFLLTTPSTTQQTPYIYQNVLGFQLNLLPLLQTQHDSLYTFTKVSFYLNHMHLLKYPYTSIFIHVSFSVQQSPRQPSQSINISSLLSPLCLSLSLSLCFLPSFLRCYTSYLLSFFKSPCFVDLAFLFLPL